MFNKILTGSVALSLAAVMAFGAQGVRFNVAEGDKEEAYMEMMDGLEDAVGFVLSDPHERINDAYKSKYGSPEKDGAPNPAYDPDYKQYLDNLGFFSVAHDEKLRELMLKAPEVGGFSPFNLHIYKKAEEDKSYVGHVMPETMLDIIGVEDEAVRKEFIGMFPELDAYLDEHIGGEVQIVEYDKLNEKPMMTYELDIAAFMEANEIEDAEEFIDEFQGVFEETFEENKYIIAGYKNFHEVYTEEGENPENFERFDAYWVYSLCHFQFSYGIFNKGRPDAGVFAPCSMYMYIEKDSNTLHIGMPRLTTWGAVMGIKDEVKAKALADLDAEITSIMTELGAVEK
jgi:uncharacterized protein (DUF302 family)